MTSFDRALNAVLFILTHLVDLVGTIAMMPIVLPYLGTLTKLQADYRPLSSRAAHESASPPHHSGFLAMFRRTMRLEGWSGLLRGLGPGMVSTVAMTLLRNLFFTLLVALAKLVLPMSLARGQLDEVLSQSRMFHIAADFALDLFIMPLSIVEHRVILHPTILPWSPSSTLRAVLTAEERSSPWRPRWDLLFIHLVTYIKNGDIDPYVRSWMGSRPEGTQTPRKAGLDSQSFRSAQGHFKPRKAALYACYIVLSAGLGTTINCLYFRLITQRPPSRRSQQTQDADPMSLIGSREPVVALRPVRDDLGASAPASNTRNRWSTAPPVERYTGPVDCLRKMVQEEGTGSLFRGFKMVLLATVGDELMGSATVFLEDHNERVFSSTGMDL